MPRLETVEEVREFYEERLRYLEQMTLNLSQANSKMLGLLLGAPTDYLAKISAQIAEAHAAIANQAHSQAHKHDHE